MKSGWTENSNKALTKIDTVYAARMSVLLAGNIRSRRANVVAVTGNSGSCRGKSYLVEPSSIIGYPQLQRAYSLYVPAYLKILYNTVGKPVRRDAGSFDPGSFDLRSEERLPAEAWR